MKIKQSIISNIGNNGYVKIFENNAYAVSIQCNPGIQFKLYGINSAEQSNWITMGPSGVFQLSLPNAIITKIQFNQYTKSSLPIIIDYITNET